MKAKIHDSQADKKVNGKRTDVRGLPEVLTTMEVREVLSSMSSVGMKAIILRKAVGRYNSMTMKGPSFLRRSSTTRSSIRVLYFTLFCGFFRILWTKFGISWRILQSGEAKISIFHGVWYEGERCDEQWLCSLPVKRQRPTCSDAFHCGSPLASFGCEDLPSESGEFCLKTWTRKKSRKHPVQNSDKHQRGKGKGQSKGKKSDGDPKDYSQQGGDPNGSRWTESGRKWGKKGGKGEGKFGNQDDFQVNGNPFYTETPANKTFGKGKDSGGRGKGKSIKSNPNSKTSNNKGQRGKKRSGGNLFGGRGRGKGVNAVVAGEELVDEGQGQEVQPSGKEEWH